MLDISTLFRNLQCHFCVGLLPCTHTEWAYLCFRGVLEWSRLCQICLQMVKFCKSTVVWRSLILHLVSFNPFYNSISLVSLVRVELPGIDCSSKQQWEDPQNQFEKSRFVLPCRRKACACCYWQLVAAVRAGVVPNGNDALANILSPVCFYADGCLQASPRCQQT